MKSILIAATRAIALTVIARSKQTDTAVNFTKRCAPAVVTSALSPVSHTTVVVVVSLVLLTQRL